MENSKREALKKHSAVNYLIPSLQNSKKVWKIFSSKKKNKRTLKQERKKPNWWSKSKRSFGKLCNKSITIIHFST